MSNFADLSTRIADELDRSDIGSQIGNELRRAIRHYEHHRLWFNEAQVTVTASAGQAAYTLTTSMVVKIDAVEVRNSGGNLQLMKEIPWNRYLEEWRYNNSQGMPGYWAQYSELIWLGSVPNSGYTMVWSQVVKLASTYSDGTENAWTNHAEDLICSRAIAQLGIRLLDLPASRVNPYRMAEREAWNHLIERSAQQFMTGQPRPWK